MHWHVFKREQIKPELQGRLKFVLEISEQPGVPVIRDIYDPEGKEFPARAPGGGRAFLKNKNNGILFDGVNKDAVYSLVMSDPRIHPADDDYGRYNWAIIQNSLRFLLREQFARPEALPQAINRNTVAVAC